MTNHTQVNITPQDVLEFKILYEETYGLSITQEEANILVYEYLTFMWYIHYG